MKLVIGLQHLLSATMKEIVTKTCKHKKISYKSQRDALKGNETGASERENNPATVNEASFVEKKF